jgi:hypothetical protein
MESRAPLQPTDAAAKIRWRDRLRQNQQLVSTFAVVTVAVAGLVAALMSHNEPQGQEQAKVQPPVSNAPHEVVRAPPMVVQAPPLQPPVPRTDPARRSAPAATMASKALGAGAACRKCGVVESIAMLDRQRGYEMRIRMDDGSLRTVAQRGALPAGSRVMVERGSVRMLPGATGQG